MRHHPFESEDSLDAAFSAGLGRLLDDGGLGAFILVLANAIFEEPLWQRLRAPIEAGFAQHGTDVREGLRAGETLAATADDQLVFFKLMAIGLDYLEVTASRRPGDWELQYNPVRGLRPPRSAGEPATGIHAPFEPDGFNFNRAFLEKERLWSGVLGGRCTSFLYNKFPFVPRHLLLVPEPAACHPQFLTQDMLAFAWQLLESMGAGLPDLGLGYNSYGAHASVNHLHFQCFARAGPLPLELPRWRHNGGPEDYPAPCRVAGSARTAWRLLDQCHRHRQAYNLVMRPGRLYLLPRRLQGSYPACAWGAGHAWYEMAGGAVVTRRESYESLSAAEIVAALTAVGEDAMSALSPDRKVSS